MIRNLIAPGALLLIGVTCATFYFSRTQRIAGVEAAISEKRAAMSRLEVSSRPSEAASAAGDRTAKEPGAGRLSVADAAVKVASIGAALGDRKPTGTDYLNAMHGLLGEIGDFSVEEVLALADSLEAPLTGADPGMTGRIRQGLLLLVAEEDPEAMLARPATSRNDLLTSTALAALAKKSPAAALQWLDNTGLQGSAAPEAVLRQVVRSVFRSDFRQGLHLASELGLEGESLAALCGTLPLPREVLEQAASEFEGQRDPARRTAILEMVMTSAAFFSGVEGMEEITTGHGIPDAEIVGFLTSPAGRKSLDGLDPAQALQWVGGILNEEQQRTTVPGIVKSWARRDFNAAGSWLGSMPASETKDLSIVGFTTTVTRLDPEAAALWSLEISDKTRRQTTLTAVIEQWRRTDTPAADAWLKQQDLTNAGY
jgi:hypothetical protein